MKNLFPIISSVLLLASCAVSNEAGTDKLPRETRDRLDEAVVKQAVESRRFIVRLDRMYTMGNFLDLKPRSNYIIVDGNKAAINAAYMGRQYDALPIAGINMKGQTVNYELIKKMKNGNYEVRMRVDNGSAAFDVYLTIGKTGVANASINSMRLQGARYRGHVIPIGNKAFVPEGSEII